MDLLQVISEPTRRRIVQLVWDRERTAGEIAAEFDTTFGAVSQHLRILRDAGAVVVRREGNRRYYLADRQVLGTVAEQVASMWSGSLDRLAAAAEVQALRGAPGKEDATDA
jgi:DNA-binding transcriptional ArsR family regulator